MTDANGETVPTLGPDDYLLATTRTHVMRYQGRNDDGYRWWRLACGSRHTDLDGTWVSADDVATFGLAMCGNCARTKHADSGRRPNDGH